MQVRIETLAHALDLLGTRIDWPDMPSTTITSLGTHDGHPWVGLGQHENDDGRPVVAPAVAVFLPATLTLAVEQRRDNDPDPWRPGDGPFEKDEAVTRAMMSDLETDKPLDS